MFSVVSVGLPPGEPLYSAVAQPPSVQGLPSPCTGPRLPQTCASLFKVNLRVQPPPQTCSDLLPPATMLFLYLSFCSRGVSATHPLGRHPPGRQPPGQTPPWADTPRADTPLVQCMLGYGQQAGGTHPTGMQFVGSISVSDSVFDLVPFLH